MSRTKGASPLDPLEVRSNNLSRDDPQLLDLRHVGALNKAAGSITNSYVTVLDLDPVVPSFVSEVCFSLFSKLTRYPKLYMKPGMSVQPF